MAARADLEGLPEDQPGEHSRSRCSRRPSRAARSRSTSCTASARRASSRRGGARTATAKCPMSRSSRATSSRRGATSSSPTRTSTRCAPSRRASSIWCSSPTTRAIDPMYVDRTYYLAPDGGVAADAFAVMREGMKGKVGVGKLALYGREYLVAVRPHERGIVMHTLHHAAEIRSIDAVEELNAVPAKVKPEEIKLAQPGDRDVRGAAEPGRLQGRVPRGAAAHHRREDRRRGDRRARGRGAAEGRQPDGGAEEEPRRGQRAQKKPAKAVAAKPVAAPSASEPDGIYNLRIQNLGSRDEFSVPSCKLSICADPPEQPGPLAVGSPSQSGGVSQTNARIAITHRS